MRISMPATSDYWVNDKAGDPLFVVTAEANASLELRDPALQSQTLADGSILSLESVKIGWTNMFFAGSDKPMMTDKPPSFLS